MKKEIATENVKGYPELLSQGIISNGLIFTCGCVHVTTDGLLIEGTIEEKVHLIIKNLEEILNAGGATLVDVIKVNIYVTDIADMPKLNEVYKTYFNKTPLPVREAVCVKALPLGASVEMSMVATIKE